MADVAELQAQLDEAVGHLGTVHEALALDPNEPEALEMKKEFEQTIAELKSQIAALTAEQNAAPPPPPADGTPKYDMSKHPKFRKDGDDAPPPPPDEHRVVLNVGDSVMAKYSADKQWYAATIITKTGSSTDPLYHVKFTGYGDREQKRKYEVRPIENKKRKADGTPVGASAATATATAAVPLPPSPTPVHVQSGTVISAAPSIDPSLVQKREPSKVSDGPTRMAPAPKKLKGNKTLEKSKSSWNDWQKTGPKKPVIGAGKNLGKDSQFRTPDLPNAKVGFTGSGKPMSKDQIRSKWNYSNRDEPTD